MYGFNWNKDSYFMHKMTSEQQIIQRLFRVRQPLPSILGAWTQACMSIQASVVVQATKGNNLPLQG